MPAITTTMLTLQVSDLTSMQAFVARPNQVPHKGGLIVFQEIFGVNQHIRNVAERFAHEGYLTIAPELFHRTAQGFNAPYNDFASGRQHATQLTLPMIEADATAAHQWLSGQLTNDKIACIGFCMGGRVAYLANSVLPMRAAISYYGGGIAPGLLDRAAAQHGPFLFFGGSLDKHITRDHQNSVAAALQQAGKRFINVEVGQVDHGFFCDERSQYDADAAGQAWSLTLAFLDRYLARG